jgi:hypothetical protein
VRQLWKAAFRALATVRYLGFRGRLCVRSQIGSHCGRRTSKTANVVMGTRLGGGCAPCVARGNISWTQARKKARLDRAKTSGASLDWLMMSLIFSPTRMGSSAHFRSASYSIRTDSASSVRRRRFQTSASTGKRTWLRGLWLGVRQPFLDFAIIETDDELAEHGVMMRFVVGCKGWTGVLQSVEQFGQTGVVLEPQKKGKASRKVRPVLFDRRFLLLQL